MGDLEWSRFAWLAPGTAYQLTFTQRGKTLPAKSSDELTDEQIDAAIEALRRMKERKG